MWEGLQGLTFPDGWASSSVFQLRPQWPLFEWLWVVLTVAIGRRDPHRAGREQTCHSVRSDSELQMLRVLPDYISTSRSHVFSGPPCLEILHPVSSCTCVTGVRCRVKTILALIRYGGEGTRRRTRTPLPPPTGSDRRAQRSRGWLPPRICPPSPCGVSRSQAWT